MKLIRYNYPEFTDLFGDVDRIFRDTFAGFPAFGRLGNAVWPSLLAGNRPRLATNLYEDEENYYVQAELPGVDRKDVKVELDQSVLTISYEKTAEEDEEKEAVVYRRSVAVPEGVNESSVSAGLKDGILTVTLPRAEKKKPTEIKIQ